MSKESHDPAFPVCYQHKGEDGEIETTCEHWGMSLRDWFAGQALNGLTANETVHRFAATCKEPMYDTISGLAYKLADAMLAAREKKGEE